MDNDLDIDLNQGVEEVEVVEAEVVVDNHATDKETENDLNVVQQIFQQQNDHDDEEQQNDLNQGVEEQEVVEQVIVDEAEVVVVNHATDKETVNDQNVVQENFQQQNDHDDEEQHGQQHEPTVGMCFPSGEEFAKFCHDYAYKKGFSFFIRTATLMDSYKLQGIKRTESGIKQTANHMMKQLRLVCTKGGRRQTAGSTVTECQVFVNGNIVNGQMKITTCNLKHNHKLHPESSHLMVNYRSIDDPNISRIVNNDRAGISIVKNYNSFLVENGGHDNMTFNQRDLRNAVNLERRKTRFQGDAIALEDYFRKQHELNDEFYSAIQRDCDGRLMNMFWSDARCRAMCEDFGDIITFDTTFQTNRYEMPLAPFVAVNHHGSSIVLACALISHEDTDTFVWVFNEWLKCMGKAPLGILTDQDKAIGKAVRIVFPGVPHRLCLWHILKNASQNLGSHKKWKEIEVALRVVVHECLDPDEFDEAWDAMVNKFDISSNAWIQESYKLRDRWAPGYCRDNYWAGMSSTQRSEGMNHFLKGSVNIDTPLARFVELYEAAMGALANTEQMLNFASSDKPLPVDKTILVEYVFHNKYTNAKFKEVRDECLGLRHTYINKTSALGTVTFYKADEKIPTPISRKRWKSYTLTIDKEKGDFSCSCKLFEFRGILCKHIIRVIELEDITHIPDKYIMKCWRKDVVRRYEGIHVAYYDLDSERVKKVREITLRNKYLSTLAMHNDTTFAMYKEATDKIRMELEDLMGIERNDNDEHCWWDQSSRKVFGHRRVRPREQNERHLKKSVVPVEGGTKDPVDKRHTGRGKNTRIPNPAEKGGKSRKKYKYTPEEIAHNEEIIRDTFGSLNGRWHGTAPNNNMRGTPNVGGSSNNGVDTLAIEPSSSRIRDSNAMSYGSQPTMTIDQSHECRYTPSCSDPINERDPYWLRSTQ